MVGQFREKGIQIGKVYHCPHHPDFSPDCICRKPKPGMILQAQKEFGLDLKNSILIGDKESDFEAAINAGIERYYHIDDIRKRLTHLPL